jgi:hypothetical protein
MVGRVAGKRKSREREFSMAMTLWVDRRAQEVEMVVRRLQADHPSVSLHTLSAVVERTYDELADARVQTYRLILTERGVRRSLADSAQRGQDAPPVSAPPANSTAA